MHLGYINNLFIHNKKQTSPHYSLMKTSASLSVDSGDVLLRGINGRWWDLLLHWLGKQIETYLRIMVLGMVSLFEFWDQFQCVCVEGGFPHNKQF